MHLPNMILIIFILMEKTAILRTKKNDKEKINPLVNDKM